MSFSAPPGWRCASPTTGARATRRCSMRWRRRSPAGRRSRSSILPAAPARRCARSAPRIKARQNWRLVDNDLSLLARAPQSSPPNVNVVTVPVDLARDLEVALDGPVDLVTTSALLDLVSDEWLERFAVETAARRLPVYAALSYDGRDRARRRPMPLDQKIVAAVNAHQRTDKGFGPALGPAAAQAAVERFERVGYSVVQGASDWVFEPADREIQIEILSGWAAAAREMGDLPLAGRDRLADAPARSRRRRALIDPRRSRRLLRAADRPRAEPTDRSRTAPRRRADARCIGVRSASSTRAIGGSVKLGRPEPRMIGATMTCSRSRHLAARKRDTVSAPPSISMRRKPAFGERGEDRRRRDLSIGLRACRRSRRRRAAAALRRRRSPPGGARRRPRAACAPAGSRPRGVDARPAPGCGPATRRTVSCGSSASAVPTPTTTASTSARSRCRCVKPAGPLM